MKSIRKDTAEIVAKLLKFMSVEDIASELEVSFYTAYNWKTGKKPARKGDYEMLKSLLLRAERGERK